MKQILLWIKVAGAGICTGICGLLGGWDMALKVLITLTIIDYVTGVLAAIYLKKISSDISYKGIIKKVGIYIIIALAYQVDQYTGTNFLRTAVIGFYIATEGISIVENLCKTDLPIPEVIKKVLEQLKNKNDKGSEVK